MEKEKISQLIEQNYSQRMIAEKFNMSQSNIRYWLKKYNLITKINPYNKKERPNDKYCPICNTVKPISEFYNRSNRDNGGGYCKNCSNKYTTERLKRVKIKMIKYKGGKCEQCSLTLEESHYSVFDFHHINPKEKDINFRRIKSQKWEKIKNEIDQCMLLCSNCHRIIHSKF